jgi:ankyrin repeat protein
MPDRTLPERPNLTQYKKQAKGLLRDVAEGVVSARERVRKHHPRFRGIRDSEWGLVQLSDAQLVVAREHGYASWPEFAKHIEMLRVIRSLQELGDPVNVFIEVATVDRRGWHGSGSLEYAEMVRLRYPEVARANVFSAAVLGDAGLVREFLARDRSLATAQGGPHGWDALTYLCFSRYLRIEKDRAESFVEAARALLEGGADANTGWIEYIDEVPRPVKEAAIYGAAGLAQNPGLTRLLLEYGADPNDEETPYHVPESDDNTVLRILLESGKFNEASLACVLLRKADWHDEEGLRLVLEHGVSPNLFTRFGLTVLHQAVLRDNRLGTLEVLLDHGADPLLPNARDGGSAIVMAARRGRRDFIELLRRRGITANGGPLEAMIVACARGDSAEASELVSQYAREAEQLLSIGGEILCDLAGNGNVEGIRCLLDLGVSPGSVRGENDLYWDVTKETTALHNAAWRMQHAVVRELIRRGAPINDGKGRTPLAMAVKACVDSYWKSRRRPDSVAALLAAGASSKGIALPTGYDAIDELLIQAR